MALMPIFDAASIKESNELLSLIFLRSWVNHSVWKIYQPICFVSSSLSPAHFSFLVRSTNKQPTSEMISPKVLTKMWLAVFIFSERYRRVDLNSSVVVKNASFQSFLSSSVLAFVAALAVWKIIEDIAVNGLAKFVWIEKLLSREPVTIET